MPAPHDPAALVVALPAIPARGARIAIAAGADRLRFRGAAFAVDGVVRLDGRIERMERDGFRLRAGLGGSVTLECGRCLAEFAFGLDEPLDLAYLPAEAASAAGNDQGLDSGDMNVSFHDGDRLDLAVTLWEQIHLALPAKPLCRPECLGLCPQCGADRNEADACACVADAPRSGLAALADLADFSGRAPRGRERRRR